MHNYSPLGTTSSLCEQFILDKTVYPHSRFKVQTKACFGLMAHGGACPPTASVIADDDPQAQILV